tara:strand:+ start:597 stop:1586 length:990 start_codon:yes stop_codon:yes gene_type:complete
MKMINVIYNKLKNIKQFIYLSLAMFFLMSNLVYGGDELNKVYAEIEKEHKNFIKETKKIREQFKSLTGVTDSAEAMIIDHAIEEMNQVMEFAHESFKDNDLEMTAMTLDYIDRSLNDINHLVPKEFTNDLSVIDMDSMPEEHVQQIMETTQQMQVNKKEKLTSLVEGMTEIEQKGLNLFEVSKNLNEIGVDTLNVEDIAKAVSEDPSLKAGVLEAVEKGVSPEDFSKQLETMAEAERLGIAESTAAVSEAAEAVGLVKNAMPSLETMQSDFFDADAHNAAMAELAADIASGDINSTISKAEAAVPVYTQSDREAQIAKSKRQETCPKCD